MTIEEHLGIKVETAQSGSAVVSMVVSRNMLNGHDVCHGGLVYALAHAAWWQALGTDGPASGSESGTIEYLKPGRLGDRLTAYGSACAEGASSKVYDVEVRNQDDEVVALFRGFSS